jgi:hypothetical protein
MQPHLTVRRLLCSLVLGLLATLVGLLPPNVPLAAGCISRQPIREPDPGRWCRRSWRWVSPALLTGLTLGVVFFLRTSPGEAAGLVTSCDEASLRTALAGGGTVTFACSGSPSIALSS